MEISRASAYVFFVMLALVWAGFTWVVFSLIRLTRRMDSVDENRKRTLAFFKGAMEEPATGRKSRFVAPKMGGN